MTFEENLQQLQQLTEKLEKESLPLEEAIAVYQRECSCQKPAGMLCRKQKNSFL